MKRAIQSCLFGFVFTCGTNSKAVKVKNRFFHLLSTFYKVNIQENDTMRKSFKICIKRDLEVGCLNGVTGSFCWHQNISLKNFIKRTRPEPSVFENFHHQFYRCSRTRPDIFCSILFVS